MPDDRRVLEGVGRLVLDGTNVLHAIRRSPVPLPAVALIGRLRAIVPPGVAITVVLDGSPEHGLVARHIASGVEVRHSGRFSADELIAQLLDTRGQDNSGTLVVTDDIELSQAVRRSGGRTARTGWLIGRAWCRLRRPRSGREARALPRTPVPPGRATQTHPTRRAGLPAAARPASAAPRIAARPGRGRRGATRKGGPLASPPGRGEVDSAVHRIYAACMQRFPSITPRPVLAGKFLRHSCDATSAPPGSAWRSALGLTGRSPWGTAARRCRSRVWNGSGSTRRVAV